MPDLTAPSARPDLPPLPAPSDLELVRAMTAAAGLAPAPAELSALAAAYPALRAAADRLQAIAGDTDPAPVFDPVALFALPRTGRDD
jgi:hypothetical protein